jgi:hypothetical protein
MDSLLNILDEHDIQHHLKKAVSPIGNIVYNEIYPYIWFICIYSVLLFLVVCFNLVMLLRVLRQSPSNGFVYNMS